MAKSDLEGRPVDLSDYLYPLAGRCVHARWSTRVHVGTTSSLVHVYMYIRIGKQIMLSLGLGFL